MLGTDGNLWLEQAPFGKVPPARQPVDANVRAFQALGVNAFVWVLGTDGKLWLEQAPFGRVPPKRQQIDANVLAFQPLDINDVIVLGSDGNLWLEQAPFGTVPPKRQQIDGNVMEFMASDTQNVLVLGTDGKLVAREGSIWQGAARPGAGRRNFVWTADAKRVLAAVKRGKEKLELIH